MKLYNHDPELILAALRDDPGAWDRLLLFWRPVIFRWARRMGGRHIDPHDILQDVCSIVWVHLETLKSPEKTFPAWLYRVTLREIMRAQRRAWLRKVLLWERLPERSDPSGGPERQLEMSQIARKVQEILERLPENQREVLVLHEIDGLSLSEVAALTGANLGTVKSRLRLGRARFEESAQDLLPPGGGSSHTEEELAFPYSANTSSIPFLGRLAAGGVL